MRKTACSLTLSLALLLGGCDLMSGKDATAEATSAPAAQVAAAPQDQLGARDPAPGATPPADLATLQHELFWKQNALDPPRDKTKKAGGQSTIGIVVTPVPVSGRPLRLSKKRRSRAIDN